MMQGLVWGWIGFVLLLGSIARAWSASPIQVDIVPTGMSEAGAQVLSQMILEHPSVKRRLDGSRFRVIEQDFGVNDDASFKNEADTGDEARHLTGRYRFAIYDYSRDRLFTVSGNLADRVSQPRIEESSAQPAPAPEELEEAYALLRKDPVLGAEVSAGAREPYEAMPPTVDTSYARIGKGERILAIGLRPTSAGQASNEIVGVSLSSGRVFRYPGGAPPTSLALDPACGWPYAGQANTARGVSGSAAVTVTSETGESLWKFTVIRPSASSGAYGSAIDLKDILYKGKRVLSRLHVPILNVQYAGGVCGPYRDWQYSESPFEAIGTDLAPGIRRTTAPPRTIFESGTDRGNFRGVAVHIEGDVTLLTTELSAGWYRYMSEYRFHADGTIEPVFKFSGVYNACICRTHNHHVYWRMDFDLGEAANDSIQVSDGTSWRTIGNEAKQYRNASNQAWRVVDTVTGQGYEIIPGPRDGTADTYGRGDVWALRYRDGQVDDSRVRTSTAAGLDAFNTGEPIASADVVLWYSAHFQHSRDGAEIPHLVGPILRPVPVSPSM